MLFSLGIFQTLKLMTFSCSATSDSMTSRAPSSPVEAPPVINHHGLNFKPMFTTLRSHINCHKAELQKSMVWTSAAGPCTCIKRLAIYINPHQSTSYCFHGARNRTAWTVKGFHDTGLVSKPEKFRPSRQVRDERFVKQSCSRCMSNEVHTAKPCIHLQGR